MNDDFEPIRPVDTSNTADAVQETEPIAAMVFASDRRIGGAGHSPQIESYMDQCCSVVIIACFSACWHLGISCCVFQGSTDTAIRANPSKVLAIVCDAYKVRHGKYPDKLTTLLQRDEFGVNWIDDPAKLIDPWGRMYQYDAKGQRNNGLHADIWVVTPDGTIIGNWPRMFPKR